VTAAMLVLLGLSSPLRAPDLQVEARTATGVNLPDLADAVARALVASGIRVVLGVPAREPCFHCAQVTVTEIGHESCRIDVSQERHAASATLRFPAGSPLFDRARAISIQARLLVTWESSPTSTTKDAMARAAARKPEPKKPVDRFLDGMQIAGAEQATTVGRVAPPAKDSPFGTSPQPEPVRVPDPQVVPERHVDATPAASERHVDRIEARPAEAVRSQPQRATPAETLSVSVAPPKQQWPWIPTILGSGAAVAAGISAVMARNRYNALSDRSRTYGSAEALKAEGQNWQVASIVLSGAAVVGLTTGIFGFITRSTKRPAAAALATPVPGGGMMMIAGDLP